jgi:C1A family cysteine protease
MHSPNDGVLGGHAVLVAGYENSQSRFICRNSWGTEWGMNGYFAIPYAYRCNNNSLIAAFLILIGTYYSANCIYSFIRQEAEYYCGK